MSARDEVLGRIRAANAAAAAQADLSPRGEPGAASYRTQGDQGPAALLDLFAGRLADYRAIVARTTADGLAGEVAAALARRGARRVVVPPGLDVLRGEALPAGVEVITDDALDSSALDASALDASALDASALDDCDGVVTGVTVAIAETGTIVLDGSPDQGRRAITLVPDYHLCIVRAEQVVELVPEAVARLSGAAARPLTWISGPSATSDIELERVEGVHGPRTLEVIIVEP